MFIILVKNGYYPLFGFVFEAFNVFNHPNFGTPRLGAAYILRKADRLKSFAARSMPGKQYPLVIQTHFFNPETFVIDGPWSSGFAAQVLASKGFVVVQVG